MVPLCLQATQPYLPRHKTSRAGFTQRFHDFHDKEVMQPGADKEGDALERWGSVSYRPRSNAKRSQYPSGSRKLQQNDCKIFGFTLLEILIALALIAILMVAAAPYMAEAWKNNQREHLADSIEKLAIETRSQAILTGETRFISLSNPIFLPKGWKLEVQRFTDLKFRTPLVDELWQFNSEGICDPLSLRLLGPGEPIIMKFDPITGQVLHEEP